MNPKRKPIQAVFGDSFFLNYRIYISLGLGSMLANVCLVFADLILFWMEIAFLIYHISATNTMNFMTANFVFPIRQQFSNFYSKLLKSTSIHFRTNLKTLLSFVSILILFSILIFYLSEWIEKRSQLFLFKKFKARFDKSIKLFNDHAPVQQEFLEYLYD